MQDLVLSLPMVQTPFPKRILFNSGDFGTLTTERECWRLQGYSEFQSPYGDFGTLTLSLSTRSQTGSQAIFSNLRLFRLFFSDPGEK